MSRRVVIMLVAAALSGCAGGGAEQRAPAKEKAPAAPANSNPPASSPAASEPAPAAPAPQVLAADAPPDWYLAAPARGEGRLRASATADAADLVEVRRSAVSAGTEALRKAHGPGELRDVQTDKIEVVRRAAGGYRAFILMSCVDEGGR